MTLSFVSSSTPIFVYGRDGIIKYSFASTLDGESTGPGSVTYTVNNKLVASDNIEQGEVAFNAGKYLSLGDNTLVVQVTDAYGTTRKLTFKINAVSISVTSTFDDSKAYIGAISFPYIPLGAVEKTIHFILDGRETGSYVTSVSNRQLTYSISAQSHGAHALEVYATATIGEVEVESDHIRYDFISIVAGNDTPIIASSFRTTEVEQFGTLQIPYIIYNPAATTSEITLSVNGETISEQTVDRTRQTWSYRAETPGELELKIICGSVSKTFKLTVSESEIDVQPELADLALFLTSVNRSNNEEGRNVWNYGEIFALLTAFNWATNGWIKTVEGFVALRVSGDARVTIPYNSFANDFRATGKTIEFEFETRDVTDYDAVVLSCMNGGIGLEVTAQKAIFKSQQTTVETQFKEDERVRVSFVVEKKAENRLIFVYVNGEICGVMQYPEQDNFTQSNPVGISIGSSNCTSDIFNIRVYDNNLNRYQLLDNYIADMDSIELKREMYERNRIYDDYGNVSYEKLSGKMPALTIIGTLPSYKGDKVTCAMAYEDKEHPERSWICPVVQNDVQGTSSQYYPRKNYKFKFKALLDMISKGGTSEKFPVREGGIPVNCFCMKADFAESSGCHNTGMARMIDFILRGLDQLTPPQRTDKRVRTTIDGYPIVIFHKETEESDPTFLGKYNFNNDKSTQETFGFTDGCECWEIRNNTSDRVLFKSSDYSTDDWLNDFEARYPEDSTDFTKLKRLTDWLVSVKENPVKFKAEASQYLDMDFMLSYYVLTEFFAMVDQRAKNVFLTTYDGTHWMVIFYDNDTCLGINNEGVNAFDFTVEYHDKIGTQDVWNGEQSTLWNNIEQAYKEEIAAMYADMRKNGLLTYEKCDYYLNREQCDKWGESVYNEDGYFKYIRPLLDEGNGSYLYAAQGSRKMHRIWWLNNRFKYMDSKYVAGDYKNDFATMRLYTPTEWTGVAPNADITVTSYSGQYVNIKYGSYIVGGRTRKNVPYKVTSPDIQFNDTETIIYGAGQISSLGDLSALYPGTVDVTKMTKLVELVIGSGVAGYQNTNLEVLSVGANDLLRKLDVRNCPNLKQAIDLSQCNGIREVWAEGTGTTAVVLPAGGNVTLLHLPDTITNLTVRNQSQLQESGLSIAGVDNLTTIRWENTGSVNVFGIIDRCLALDTVKLERIRLIGVSGGANSIDTLVALSKLKGLDENGNNTGHAVITGEYHVGIVSESKLAEMRAAFPELEITYTTLRPDSVTTLVFKSSRSMAIADGILECNFEAAKINEYTYKVTSEDDVTLNFTFKCENHKDYSDTYYVSGTRTQEYTVTYIPLRKIRVKVYGQSVYVKGAVVTINGKQYISDADGYVYYRGGEAISGSVTAYGYTGNTFSYSAAVYDTNNTLDVYASVDIKFIVKFGSLLIEGAVVTCNGQKATTNIYGECLLSIGKGTYDYVVSHDDYYDVSGKINVSNLGFNVNVGVEPKKVDLVFTAKSDSNVLLEGVTVTCNNLVGITDAAGKVTLSVDSKQTHSYTATKLDYYETTGDVSVSTSPVSVALVLELDIVSLKPVENGNIQLLVQGNTIDMNLECDGSEFIINWGDGETTAGTSSVSQNCKHTYADSGLHQIEIGNCSGVYSCGGLQSCLIAYWSIGNSAVKNISFGFHSKLKYYGDVFINDAERTSLSRMFYSCKMKTYDLAPFARMTKVTDLSSMFERCTEMVSLDLSPLASMTEVTKLSRFLCYCENLENIDLSPLAGMTKTNNLSCFFGSHNGGGCNKLESIDLTPFSSMINVTDLSGFLAKCRGLTSIDLSPLSSLKKVYDLSRLLYGCDNLISLDLTPISSLINVNNLTEMAYGCSKIQHIKNDTLENITKVISNNMDSVFAYCIALRKIHLPKGLNELGDSMYGSCRSLKYIIADHLVPYSIRSNTFSGTYNCPIYVPDESVESYKSATNWTTLADRIKPVSQFVLDFPNEEM